MGIFSPDDKDWPASTAEPLSPETEAKLRELSGKVARHAMKKFNKAFWQQVQQAYPPEQLEK